MPLAGIFSGLEISASGLRAQRVRQNIIASNLANAETTRTDEGGPYKRQTVILKSNDVYREKKAVFEKEKLHGTMTDKEHLAIPNLVNLSDPDYVGSGVRIAEIREDSSPARMIYNPEHPDADKKGYVAMPNVNVVQEMTDMITATRAYEANATAFNASKSMIMRALEL